MEFRTPVTIDKSPFAIDPCERMLFVGSCFADNIGSRFVDDKFRATVNPYGVMYNPASILHTVERYLAAETAEVARTAVFTLGTNRVYILNETGEIVDNCQKRPQRLFTERSLSVDECAAYLREAIARLRERRPDMRVILTVSPIRYAKYGFHGSAVSKATLLLAADRRLRLLSGVRDSVRRASRLSLLRPRHAAPVAAGCRLHLGTLRRHVLQQQDQGVHERVAAHKSRAQPPPVQPRVGRTPRLH